MDTLGKKLFKLRTDTNMQKEDLAELLDVTIDDIDNWQTNKKTCIDLSHFN